MGIVSYLVVSSFFYLVWSSVGWKPYKAQQSENNEAAVGQEMVLTDINKKEKKRRNEGFAGTEPWGRGKQKLKY